MEEALIDGVGLPGSVDTTLNAYLAWGENMLPHLSIWTEREMIHCNLSLASQETFPLRKLFRQQL